MKRIDSTARAMGPLGRGTLLVLIANFIFTQAVWQTPAAAGKSRPVRSELDSSITKLQKFIQAGKAYSYKELVSMDFPSKLEAWTGRTQDLVARDQAAGGEVHRGDLDVLEQARQQLWELSRQQSPTSDLRPLGSGKWDWTMHLYPLFVASGSLLTSRALAGTSSFGQNIGADVIAIGGISMAVGVEVMLELFKRFDRKRLAKARREIDLERLLVDPPLLAY